MEFSYTDERFADIQMLRYRVKDFECLSINQKLYVYYLSEAALSGRDITTDQCGRYNLVIRKSLESLLIDRVDKDSDEYNAMLEYLKRLWFSNGIYHHYGCEKFQPGFTEKWLRNALMQVDKSLIINTGYDDIEELLDTICPVIFNSDVMPKRVNQTDGEDLVKTSACNFYEGVSQKEAEDYYKAKKDPALGDYQPSWGLNSRLVKKRGELVEEKYTTNGLYAQALAKVVYWLSKAKEVAENDSQREIISLLIRYYETGDLHLFDEYNIAWLKEHDGDVDFINGFIEVYGDPLGLKGTWEALVEIRDEEATERTRLISSNAQWFEDHSPVDPRFKKAKVTGVSACVIQAAMLGGDEYPSTAIGINLPNADWIRAKHGSKSITIGNITEAYNHAARGNGFDKEFVIDDATCECIEKYGDLCDNLHTDLHECLGHGSGQLLPGVSPDALKAYGSTIEEARADLFGLYYLADDKLIELGLVPDGEAYKSQYYHYMMNGLLTQYVRIKPGQQIEEAHMRNRAIIARWCLDHSEGCVELVKQEGKTYVRVNDFQKLRTLFGKLLAVIQRIKSEGDYDAARNMVETYGVRIDPELHEEILERYKKLNIAPYKGFINPWMRLVPDGKGGICDVEIDYTESYVNQMMRYSNKYGLL